MITATTSSRKTDVSKLEFPRLLISNHGNIVLMISVNGPDGKGLCVVSGGGPHRTGEYSDSWDIREFSDYDGDLAISNTD